MAIDIYRLVVGFIIHRSTVDGPTKYFNDFGDWSWLARNLIYLIETLIGDAIMIYRCYFVWPFFKFWIILLPALLWLATLALGVTEIWANATVEASGALSTNLLWPHRVADAYFTTTLIGNGLATGTSDALSFRECI
ncbi:hypothetical protein H0H93_011281 [Arthromyces matolae]|nr:hypothetical protein H0H93_011281 [Arthromyces matolae]